MKDTPSWPLLLLALLTASTVAVVSALLIVAAALSRGFTDPGALFAMAFTPFGVPVAALLALPLALAVKAGLVRGRLPIALGGLATALVYLIGGSRLAALHPGELAELLLYPASSALLALHGPHGLDLTPNQTFDVWLYRAFLAGIPLGGLLGGMTLAQAVRTGADHGRN